MVLDPKQTTLAYRCPDCGGTVMSLVGIFSLTGDMIRLKCSCGGSEMTAAYTKDRKIRLTVPCLVCPRPHSFTVSADSFFENGLLSLDCPETGLPLCMIGEKDAVIEAAKEADEDLLLVMQEAGIDSFEQLRQQNRRTEKRQSDESDMFIWDTVNFLLCELKEDGCITCRCGKDDEPDYYFELGGAGPVPGDEDGDGADAEKITVACRCCGAKAEFYLRDVAAAQEFLEIDRIDLK